jgi:hypothetical protein
MSHSHDTSQPSWRLVWVGVIALTAGVLTTWLRTESVPATLGLGFASAVISVALVWFIKRTGRAR